MPDRTSPPARQRRPDLPAFYGGRRESGEAAPHSQKGELDKCVALTPHREAHIRQSYTIGGDLNRASKLLLEEGMSLVECLA
jgi:hypothetical protein